MSLTSVFAAAASANREAGTPKSQGTLVNNMNDALVKGDYAALGSRKLEILKLTEGVLEAFDTGRFDLYSRFCDPHITSIEPETLGWFKKIKLLLFYRLSLKHIWS